mmetsp:Transcript_13649/g.58300  ORF Transcript_13649/g.58300 Transcript_13649/m.58300 type:complete len:267 (+) Transcript_13649:1323-2123(+)
MPLRQLTYSPTPFSFAAWWKYDPQSARLHASQSPFALTVETRCCFMMSSSCALTSRAFFNPFPCRKCLLHQSVRYPLFFHCWYTLSRVRWSLSGTKNFSRAASLSSSRSFGRNHTGGTESIAMTVSISFEHPRVSAFRSICAKGGSTGNSTIFAPKEVSSPAFPKAPSTQSWYIEFRMFSRGGGSMKSKSSKFSTLSDLRRSTTLPKFVRWISGTVFASSSFWKLHAVYRRKHFPGAVRPARPARCSADACEVGVTMSDSMPVRGL